MGESRGRGGDEDETPYVVKRKNEGRIKVEGKSEHR